MPAGIARRRSRRLSLGIFPNGPVFHRQHTVHAVDQGGIVADGHERPTGFADDPAEVVGEAVGGLAMQACRGLVGEQTCGIVGQSPGYGDALPFASRVAGGEAQSSGSSPRAFKALAVCSRM